MLNLKIEIMFTTFVTAKRMTLEKSELASLTIPNQAESLVDIVKKALAGQMIEAIKPTYYDDSIDETLDKDFDLSDVTRISEEIRESEEQRKAQEEETKRSEVPDNQANTDAPKPSEAGETKPDSKSAGRDDAA